MSRSIENSILKNSLYLSHEIIQKTVKNGDTVVDATTGNGKDTVFLAELVGDQGRVYSFDIQTVAIEKTTEKLKAKGIEKRVILINGSHANMCKHIDGSVKAVMFNLGYLPGGDHDICTKASSTIEAVESAMRLISVNGIITIVVYHGGDSGFEEKEHVLKFIQSIDSRHFTVTKTEFVNQINCPPILICIEKIS
jgi:tRNA G37 N-methylase Trm5